jgi:hypothetical protein
MFGGIYSLPAHCDQIQRIDLMLFSYVVRKAALPVADGATVESSAPEVYMSSYRVASLRNIFALIGNILERRLKLLSSFASLDSGTELAQPLLLITQYPGDESLRVPPLRAFSNVLSLSFGGF